MQIVIAPPAHNKLVKLKVVGLLTILFGLFGGLTWAAITPLDSAVVALGKVNVHSDRKEIQHLEGGIIESILIAEGESVKKGQLLITLDDTFADTDLKRLRAQLQELKIQESVLLAQRDSLSSPLFPGDIKNAQAGSWLSNQVESALNGFNISQSSLKNQIKILKNQSIQINEQIKGNDEERLAKKDELYYLEDEISSWKTLIERKLANKVRFLELQRETAELRGEIAQLHSQSASLKAKKVGLSLEQIKVKQIYRETASKDLSDVKINIRDISRRMDSAVNVLSRIEIRSPVDGVVVGLQVHTLGAVIKPGETILELVPEKDDLIIEARVRPTDIDKIYRSLESRIKIASYKAHEFPEFNGVVDSVSADVFENPETLDSYYIARISIPASAMVSVPGSKIKPGMPAEVLIKTGETTPLNYLMEPLLSAFRTAWRDQ